MSSQKLSYKSIIGDDNNILNVVFYLLITTKVIRTVNNNQGRSTTGNMLNRLGRGANMRETLNRRREQEHSQRSTAQKVRTEANSQERRNIPLEDLRREIVSIEEQDDESVAAIGRSPFSREIREAPLPEGFKLSNIKVYKGKADPRII